MNDWAYKLELIKARFVERRLDDDEETISSNRNGGNTRIPFGLCQRFGIEIQEGWTPRDAWKALADEGVDRKEVYRTLRENGNLNSVKKKRFDPISQLKKNPHWQNAYDRAERKVGNLYPRKKKYSKGINYKGEEVDIAVQGKGFQKLYNRIANDDGHLDIDELREMREVMAMDSIAKRCKKILGRSNSRKDKSRKSVRKAVTDVYSSTGSARKGKDGKYTYDGKIKKEFKACIVLGLPGCGKSTLVDPWSEENGAFISDCDMVKQLLPEYQATNGLAAGTVHAESKDIHDKVLNEFYEGGSKNGENLAIPILGGDKDRIDKMIRKLEKSGYDVEIKFAPGDAKKSLNRVVSRNIETGRIVPTRLVAGTGNRPQENFNAYIGMKNSKGKNYIREN